MEKIKNHYNYERRYFQIKLYLNNLLYHNSKNIYKKKESSKLHVHLQVKIIYILYIYNKHLRLNFIFPSNEPSSPSSILLPNSLPFVKDTVSA